MEEEEEDDVNYDNMLFTPQKSPMKDNFGHQGSSAKDQKDKDNVLQVSEQLSNEEVKLYSPIGVRNSSVHCYFIALVVSLIHMRGFVKTIIDDDDLLVQFDNDECAKIRARAMLGFLLEFLEAYANSTNTMGLESSYIDSLVHNVMPHGQTKEDPHEAFMFLEKMIGPILKRISSVSYKATITCNVCGTKRNETVNKGSCIVLEHPQEELEKYKMIEKDKVNEEKRPKTVRAYDQIKAHLDTFTFDQLLEATLNDQQNKFCDECKGVQLHTIENALVVPQQLECKEKLCLLFFIPKADHEGQSCPLWGNHKFTKKIPAGEKESLKASSKFIDMTNYSKFTQWECFMAKNRGNLMTSIKLQENLTIAIEDSDETCAVELTGVVSFEPDFDQEEQTGHYVTYVRSMCDGTSWYKIDDGTSTKLDDREIDILFNGAIPTKEEMGAISPRKKTRNGPKKSPMKPVFPVLLAYGAKCDCNETWKKFKNQEYDHHSTYKLFEDEVIFLQKAHEDREKLQNADSAFKQPESNVAANEEDSANGDKNEDGTAVSFMQTDVHIEEAANEGNSADGDKLGEDNNEDGPADFSAQTDSNVVSTRLSNCMLKNNKMIDEAPDEERKISGENCKHSDEAANENSADWDKLGEDKSSTLSDKTGSVDDEQKVVTENSEGNSNICTNIDRDTNEDRNKSDEDIEKAANEEICDDGDKFDEDKITKNSEGNSKSIEADARERIICTNIDRDTNEDGNKSDEDIEEAANEEICDDGDKLGEITKNSEGNSKSIEADVRERIVEQCVEALSEMFQQTRSATKSPQPPQRSMNEGEENGVDRDRLGEDITKNSEGNSNIGDECSNEEIVVVEQPTTICGDYNITKGSQVRLASRKGSLESTALGEVEEILMTQKMAIIRWDKGSRTTEKLNAIVPYVADKKRKRKLVGESVAIFSKS